MSEAIQAWSRSVKVWAREMLLGGLLASGLIPRGMRWRLLRALGLDVASSKIAPGVYFGGAKVTIGRGAFLNRGVFVDASARVTIESGVSIGPRAMLLTSTHEIAGPAGRAGRLMRGEVTVGRGAWVGAGAVVMPGVTVGAGCVVAAGAVVTKDCLEHGLYAGVPARRVRDLPHDT